MHPIILTFLLVLPSAFANVDCRTACHACRAKLDPRELLEIYCSMCQECKERRKDRLKTKIELAKQQAVVSTAATEPITATPDSKMQLGFDQMGYNDPPPATVETQEDGVDIINDLPDIPEGCPTAPPCSDDEASSLIMYHTTTTTSATTTTTTTQRPCPPMKPCKKKPKSLSRLPPPQPSPPPYPYQSLPPHICHPPPYAPLSHVPVPCFHPQPQPPLAPPLPPPVPYHYMPPPAPVPHYLQPWPAPAPPAQPLLPTIGPLPSRNRKIRTTDADYLYMFVGLPKNVVKKS